MVLPYTWNVKLSLSLSVFFFCRPLPLASQLAPGPPAASRALPDGFKALIACSLALTAGSKALLAC